MSKTAFIGLGNMGQGMARCMMQAGIPLTGFDLSPDARTMFAANGGTPEDSAEAAADGAELLFVMVQTAAQADAALIAGGALAALAPGAVVVLCSTVAPSEARALETAIAGSGHMMLDAPVSGGQVGADAGQLTVMASGPPEAFGRAGPALETIAKTVHRLGDEPGLGATYKVVHQLAAGVHLVAAAELLAFGEKAGCDPQKLFEIVTASAGRSWMMEDRGPKMLAPDGSVASSVDIFVKDLGLVVAAAGESGAQVPLAEAALAMMRATSAKGLGAQDDSLVIRAYDARPDTPESKS